MSASVSWPRWYLKGSPSSSAIITCLTVLLQLFFPLIGCTTCHISKTNLSWVFLIFTAGLQGTLVQLRPTSTACSHSHGAWWSRVFPVPSWPLLLTFKAVNARGALVIDETGTILWPFWLEKKDQQSLSQVVHASQMPEGLLLLSFSNTACNHFHLVELDAAKKMLWSHELKAKEHSLEMVISAFRMKSSTTLLQDRSGSLHELDQEGKPYGCSTRQKTWLCCPWTSPQQPHAGLGEQNRCWKKAQGLLDLAGVGVGTSDSTTNLWQLWMAAEEAVQQHNHLPGQSRMHANLEQGSQSGGIGEQ